MASPGSTEKGIPPDADAVRRMFGEIAPSYDRLNRLLSLGIDRSWRKRAVREMSLPQGAELLDICCGTGDLTLAFARAGALATGVDFAAAMLPIARRKGAALGLGTEFLQADARQLPFQPRSFDAVSVAFGIRNVPKAETALRECARVLRPGGQLCILEFFRVERRFWGALFRFYFHHVLPRLARLIPKGRTGAYDYLPASVEDFSTVAEFASLLTEADFGEVRAIPLTGGIAQLVLARKPA